MKRSIVSTVLLFVVTIMTVACGSSPQTGEQATTRKSILSKDMPIWVRTQDYSDGKKVCVSSALSTTEDTIIEDMDSAERAGRIKLGESMQTLVNSEFDDYYQRVSAQGGRNDERAIEYGGVAQTINQLVNGARRVDTWDDGKRVFVLVCIETEKFDDAINSMKNMSENLKEAVIKRAHNKWEEIRQRSKEESSK